MKPSKSVSKNYFSRVSLISLIILFVLTGCTGCAILGKSREEWPMPSKPELKSVEVVPIKEIQIEQNGYYLTKKHAINLADNIVELEAYIQKLEVLTKAMKNYYE